MKCIASIVALVLLWDDPGSTSFVLTAIGLAVVIVGILIVVSTMASWSAIPASPPMTRSKPPSISPSASS